MANHRLPEVNGDEGTWGTILNDFLTNEHYNNDNAGAGTADSGGHQHITVRAGAVAAGSAPIKLTSGPLMSTSEVGAVEFLSDNLYFTQTTGRARKAVATYYDDANGATGDMYYRDGDGNFARIPIGPATTCYRHQMEFLLGLVTLQVAIPSITLMAVQRLVFMVVRLLSMEVGRNGYFNPIQA